MTTTTEPHPHQLTPEEQAADTGRAKWNASKALAHEAYLAAKRVHDSFDETADPVWTAHAKIACDHAWLLYEALVLETEW